MSDHIHETAGQTPDTVQEELPQINEDEVTEVLITRFLYTYLLYDSNLSHAENCYFNNRHAFAERAVQKAKAIPPGDRNWPEHLTWAYNQVLSEDIEAFIAHICGGSLSRAEYEVLFAEVVAEYEGSSGNGQEGRQ